MSERETTQAADMGAKKYKERIHRDSSNLDKNGNLPFTFKTPKKQKAANVYFRCGGCGHEAAVTEDTVVVICGSCKAVCRLKSKKDKDEEQL